MDPEIQKLKQLEAMATPGDWTLTYNAPGYVLQNSETRIARILTARDFCDGRFLTELRNTAIPLLERLAQERDVARAERDCARKQRDMAQASMAELKKAASFDIPTPYRPDTLSEVRHRIRWVHRLCILLMDRLKKAENRIRELEETNSTRYDFYNAEVEKRKAEGAISLAPDQLKVIQHALANPDHGTGGGLCFAQARKIVESKLGEITHDAGH